MTQTAGRYRISLQPLIPRPALPGIIIVRLHVQSPVKKGNSLEIIVDRRRRHTVVTTSTTLPLLSSRLQNPVTSTGRLVKAKIFGPFRLLFLHSAKSTLAGESAMRCRILSSSSTVYQPVYASVCNGWCLSQSYAPTTLI